MKRIHRLAAEIFCYSYDNYIDHLGINERFDKIMPHDARALEAAIKENWPNKKLAKKLDLSTEIAADLKERTIKALKIVDAKNSVEAFKESVRQSIQHALKEGLDNQKSIDDLVTQVSYRAADLSVLLEKDGHSLHQHSPQLRSHKTCD